MARGWICLTDPKPESETSFASLVDALGKFERAWMEHGGDGKDVWCTEWLRVSGDSDATIDLKVQVAKSSLQRMKSITKVLASISASLEESIDFVTEQSLNVVRSHGFSSLPDDMISRIFELYHEGYAAPIGECPDLGWGKSFRASNVLAQVNKHLRRIALHLPALWDYVPFKTRHVKEMVANLNERCQNPNIFINYNIFQKSDNSAGADFLRLLHPASQWRGLNVIHGRYNGGRCYEDVSTISGGTLAGLLDLRIARRDICFLDEETSSEVSEHDLNLLSRWRLPALKRLTLVNIVPARMFCPNTRECHIALKFFRGDWDLCALEELLRCIPQLEALSFSFEYSNVNIDREKFVRMIVYAGGSVSLPRLEILAISVTGETTGGAFLMDLMDLLDVSTISCLKISLSLEPNYEVHEREGEDEYLDAIFLSDGRTRPFPNVKEFWLSLRRHKECYNSSYIYSFLMFSVPCVRNLVLDVPSCTEPSFEEIFKYLGDLQSVRLRDCNLFDGELVVHDLERIDRQKLAQIKTFEFEGNPGLFKYKDDLKRILGEKLVWKA